ncbi:ATP synthase F0 subunit C [Candidatus Dependentiae bacterium]|nr:ATP synthase F0 subunit C [Candidatus Dependentiae bacterium]
MINAQIIHYLAAFITLALAAIGGGISQGFASLACIDAIQRQPCSYQQNFRTLVIGLALIESGIIIALVTTLILIFNTQPLTIGIAYGELGIAAAIGIAGGAVSIASSFVVQAATESIGRQPFFGSKITTVMLLAQSIMEAPIIIAFIVSLLIKNRINTNPELIYGLQSLATGVAIGLGSIGPSIGQAIFTQAACRSIGTNKNAYNKIFSFMLLLEAVIETPFIFCLLVSLLILFHPLDGAILSDTLILGSAGFAISIGALGTATGIGFTASKSVASLAQNPDTYPSLMRTTLLVVAFIESSIIYAMIVALMLIMGV